MELADLSPLPQAVHAALLHLLETLVQAFPQGQAAPQPGEPPPRFPRRPLELQILEILETVAPMPVTPRQMAVLCQQPHEAVRATLNALAVLGTIQHLSAGSYSHGQPSGEQPFRSRKKGGDRPPPSEVQLPSTQYAARIARIVAQETRQAGEKSHTELGRTSTTHRERDER